MDSALSEIFFAIPNEKLVPGWIRRSTCTSSSVRLRAKMKLKWRSRNLRDNIASIRKNGTKIYSAEENEGHCYGVFRNRSILTFDRLYNFAVNPLMELAAACNPHFAERSALRLPAAAPSPYLAGGDLGQIKMALVNVCGTVCDGAYASCAVRDAER